MNTRGTNWIKVYCGDIVVDRRDPRHEGRVEAVIQGAYARVRWTENQWLSDIPLRHIQRVQPRTA